jgi:L-threonylcarbamoyladenylate synthase
MQVGSGGTIGIRISSSPVIQALLNKMDTPLTATSANISGQAGPSSVREIATTLGIGIEMYLDAGELSGIPSTVVKCQGNEITILRAGAIPEVEIWRALEKSRRE